MEGIKFGPMVYFEFKCGTPDDRCHDKLSKMFGDNAPDKSTISRWYREYERQKKPNEIEETLKTFYGPTALGPMVLYNLKNGVPSDRCYDKLSQIFGDDAPDKSTIARWYREFESGKKPKARGMKRGRGEEDNDAEDNGGRGDEKLMHLSQDEKRGNTEWARAMQRRRREKQREREDGGGNRGQQQGGGNRGQQQGGASRGQQHRGGNNNKRRQSGESYGEDQESEYSDESDLEEFKKSGYGNSRDRRGDSNWGRMMTERKKEKAREESEDDEKPADEKADGRSARGGFGMGVQRRRQSGGAGRRQSGGDGGRQSGGDGRRLNQPHRGDSEWGRAMNRRKKEKAMEESESGSDDESEDDESGERGGQKGGRGSGGGNN